MHHVIHIRLTNVDAQSQPQVTDAGEDSWFFFRILKCLEQLPFVTLTKLVLVIYLSNSEG